jgi:hypothetical protein
MQISRGVVPLVATRFSCFSTSVSCCFPASVGEAMFEEAMTAVFDEAVAPEVF